jgi:hypothetical protein
LPYEVEKRRWSAPVRDNSLLLIRCGGRVRNTPVAHTEEIATSMGNDTGIDRFIASFQSSYNAHSASVVTDLYAEDARWMAQPDP